MRNNTDLTHLVGQAVTFPSGTAVLTGTVGRAGTSVIWVTFDVGGDEYRFNRSQDGSFRRHGSSTDPRAAVLTFASAPVAPAPTPSPVIPPEPAAATRIEFTPDQAELADLVTRIVYLYTGWQDADTAARAKVADPTQGLSSFRVDDLIAAAGTEAPRIQIAHFLATVDGTAVVRAEATGRVMEILDEAKLREMLDYFTTAVTERFTGWYKPNSTSNADVEIKLSEHAAWQRAWRVATGRHF